MGLLPEKSGWNGHFIGEFYYFVNVLGSQSIKKGEKPGKCSGSAFYFA